MATQSKQAPKVTGSRKTEAIIGTGAAQITKALVAVEAGIAQLKALSEKTEELSAEIADKENKIIGLDIQFEEELRAKKVGVELDIKSFTEKQFEAKLKEMGLIAVSESEYNSLTSENTSLKRATDEAVAKAVDEANAASRASYESLKELNEAKAQAKEATIAATLEALKEQVQFYKDQNVALYKQLEAERTAGTERIKSIQQPSITMQGSKS